MSMYNKIYRKIKEFITEDFVDKISYLLNKQTNITITSNVYSGQALNGATGNNTKRITIPVGQTGVTSYIRWDIPVTQFSNWSDLIGIPVTFSYKVLTSAGLYPTRLLSSKLDVVRNGSPVTQTLSNNTITSYSDTVLLVQFTYTPTVADQTFRPILQMPPSALAAMETLFFEIQDITYNYILPISLAKYTEKILTVSPDGTKDFLTPKLANDSITDSAKNRPYRIIVFPGTYLMTTELVIKPFVHIQGTNKDLCHLKGELPVDSDDATITLISTVKLIKDAFMSNLTITGRNMRYAVHSEEGGLNIDSIHNIENCYIRHFGNQTANDYRTANSLPPVSWTSDRPWGYGSASGEIETYNNCIFIGRNEGYYVHNNLNFVKPNINILTNSSVISENTFGQVILIQNLGSGTNDRVDLINCDTSVGYIRSNDSPWITQDSLKQYANHQEYSINVSGHKKPIGFKEDCRGKALKIESQNTSNASTVRVSGTASDVIFGINPTYKDFGWGVKGYVYGYWDISGILVGLSSNISVNNTLGRRLGDCSSVNKVLNVVVDGGTPIVITFNTNLTAVSNATIISTINAALSTSATASEYLPVSKEFYPQMRGMQMYLKNNSTTKTIPQYSPCCYDTTKSTVRVMTGADSSTLFIGFALFPIAPQATERVLIEGNMHKSQTVGVTGTSSLILNADVSMSATEGTIEISNSKIIGKGIATDWFYFKGNV